MARSEHNWAFFRAGGVDQVALRDGSDVKALSTLDKKLWVALACPTKGTEIDEKTLSLIDSDQDGRIRPPEILEAVSWSEKVFKSLEVLFEKGAALPLAQLNDATKEGKAVLASAKRILRDQDKKDAKEISLDDVSALEKLFVATKLNGDGVVPADSAESPELEKAIAEMIEAVGSVPDRSGKPGIDKALVEKFVAEAEAYLAWSKEGEAEGLAPLGADTAAAAAALTDVEEKVRDYFTRSRVASFDARASTSLNATDAELTALSPKLLAASDDDLKKLPLAKVEAARALPLEAGVNPAWSAAIAAFAKLAVTPLCGAKTMLSEADFETVVAKLAPARSWMAKKPSTGVAKLAPARVAELVAHEEAALNLIDEDAALADDYAEITAVEKAIRIRRDLLRLLRNFVSFADFYNKKDGSFQAGTLFLDARQCELVIYVNDAAKHAALAGMSKFYLAYCDCSRKDGAKTQIVAAFTSGDIDNLMVGRNGVFYDRNGQDWDATITSIVENPISVRQAFWSPYKRFIRTVEEYVAKRASDEETHSTGMVDSAAGSATRAAEAPPPAPGAAPAPAAPAPAAPPTDKPMDIGTVAAIGVAVGGIGTFLGLVFSKFLDLGVWMPVGILALLLVISGPFMLIAWLKLRQRNLGPLLDANGWAVNAMTKINVPFGGTLTKVAALPLGASRTADDPYAEKTTPWALYVFLLILIGGGVAWAMGKLDAYLPEKARSATVFARSAPSATPPPSAAPAAPPAAPPTPAK
jgi:hypothetical protein